MRQREQARGAEDEMGGGRLCREVMGLREMAADHSPGRLRGTWGSSVSLRVEGTLFRAEGYERTRIEREGL